MSLLDALRIALKNLWRRKLRTVLTIFAVCVGVIAVVSLVSIALGAQKAFIGQMESIGMLSKITIIGNKDAEMSIFSGPDNYDEEDEDSTKLTDELIEEFKSMDHVRDVYPNIEIWGYNTVVININGVEEKINAWVQGSPVTGDEDDQLSLTAGKYFDSNDDENVIIIGNNFMDKFEIEAEDIIGEEIILRSYGGMYGYYDELPDPENTDEDTWREHRSEVKAKIIGVSTMGPAEGGLYVPVEWAKKLMYDKNYKWPDDSDYQKWDQDMQKGLATMADEPKPVEELRSELEEKGYSTVSVYIDDVQLAEDIAQKFEDKFEVSAITMNDLLKEINQIFRIIEIVLAIIGSISLGVAAIGIVNTMIMSIYERTKEIGVMKAVGASKRAIKKLFTIEASLIGFLGGAFGLGIGYCLSLVANRVANYFMAQDDIPLTDIIEIPLYLILGVLAFSTIIGLLAGLYPAIRASRLDPIEALRHE